jgi:protein O-GlcNAc transferase
LDRATKLAAAENLRRACQLAPHDTAAACDFADALLELGGTEQAAAVYRHALGLDSRLPRAWYGCGCAENQRQEFGSALDCFAHALELEPDWLEARHNLARALYELGQVSEAFAEFQRCAQMECAGSERSRAMLAVIVPGVPEADHATVLAIRKRWAERDLPPIAGASKPARRGGPLRVGYVSSFFQRDNWMKPVWGLINQHDRKAVQVNLFCDCGAEQIRHGYRAHSEDAFSDSSKLSNDELAALIDAREIDVLVDLNGYSNMRRLPLFSRRVSVVTIGWFNLYATTGMSGFDYLIGDHEVVRPDEELFYSEQILRVSGSYLTFDMNYPVPDVAVRSGGRGVVFGAMASQYKITDQVITAWCRILQTCRQSVLLVKNRQMGTQSGRANLLARFEKCGIGSDRLHLQGPTEHFEFLKAYGRVDVALDTFPYNGGTTTTEALWQGVPVVTFYGDRWASRTSASILRAGGLGEFVAPDVDGYVDLAVSLANRDWLTELRKHMRERLRASSVCDTRGFAREMEALYRRVHSAAL